MNNQFKCNFIVNKTIKYINFFYLWRYLFNYYNLTLYKKLGFNLKYQNMIINKL